jgi:DNA (cytosine-5)-methyltransferase 1
MNNLKYIVVDLFCGAGGVSTGFAMAKINGNIIAKVVACVNHDAMAIKSHWTNYPEVKHFNEDIRTLDLTELKQLVVYHQRFYPSAKLVLWASLECTNFSKAKGGKPRDADSRTLAEHLDRYITSLQPDLIMIENVVEFMSWGPLDDNGKPISRKNGSCFNAWRNSINEFGYIDQWKELNSADFGAYTSRNRLFGCFAKKNININWPEASHCKKSKLKNEVPNLFLVKKLKPWQAVKNVLDLNDEGVSIFLRKKPLSDKTLQRIYAGLVKYVADGNKNFLLKYNSCDKNGKHTPPSIEEPCPVVSTQGRLGLVHTKFVTHYYGNGYNRSVDEPMGTLGTVDTAAMVSVNHFIDNQYGNGVATSVDVPCGTITNTPKMNLVHVKKNKPTKFLMNPQYFNSGGSIDNPCFTLIARMDKMPPYLVSTSCGSIAICLQEGDSEVMIKIKKFMAEYGLQDILMRMLRVPELKKIQGFDEAYTLLGTQADQKKFIGNSVVPVVVQKWIEAMANNKN